MTLLERLADGFLFFDGGTGTNLTRAGLPDGLPPDVANILLPDAVTALHRAYAETGADILKSNTFGSTPWKLAKYGYTQSQVIPVAIALAKQAGAPFVALDVGPTGRLITPMGDMGFEEAIAAYKAAALLGRDAGADCILLETFGDLYEMKAAILGVQAAGLPIFASMTIDAAGRTYMGASVETIATVLSSLPVAALGFNCGVGAKALVPYVDILRQWTNLPLLLNPNAGLPVRLNGQTVYEETPESFARQMVRAAENGATLLGGCCGTTPAHIHALTHAMQGRSPTTREPVARTAIASGTRFAELSDGSISIGERLNALCNPALRSVLCARDEDALLEEAVDQVADGASLLSLCANVPGIDEGDTLRWMVEVVQASCNAPLTLSASAPGCLEKAMRVVNGKPMIR